MSVHVRRRCSCAGAIEVELPETDQRIEAAVREHQRTLRHRDWWTAQEYADERDLRFPVTVLRRIA